MREIDTKQTVGKKAWETPKLTVHGDVAALTKDGIPPKMYGGSDGATYQQQPVKWGS